MINLNNAIRGPILESKIQWLTEANPYPIECIPSHEVDLEKIPMREEIGQGFKTTLSPSKGMSTCRAVHQFTPEAIGAHYPLCTFESSLTGPTLIVQVIKSGKVLLQEKRAGIELPFDRETTLFQHVDRINFSPILDTSTTIEITLIYIEIDLLTQVLGDSLTTHLLHALQIADCPSAQVAKIPSPISRILHSAHTDYLDHELGKLHAQAKILEYFCALAHFFQQSKNGQHSIHKDKIIQDISWELIEMEGKLPPLTDLATRYGLSVKVLNEGFKNKFDKGIYSFVTEHRLKKAHTLLDESAIPMKVIANQLGYSHVNHFITAFKKYFGYTPGSLRK